MASYVTISPNEIRKNGAVIFKKEPGEEDKFLTDAYKHFGIAYTRFHKMDEFCKLTAIGAEALFKNNNYTPEKTGLLLNSKSGSYYTDIQYHNSVFLNGKIGYKPTLFTYTLPSSILGEVCIRHNIRGENFLFIQDKPNWELLIGYAKDLFENQQYESCIIGHVDYYAPDNLGAYLVQIKATEINNPEFIYQLSKNNNHENATIS